MANYNSADVTLLVGPYDLTNVSNKFEDSVSDPAVDTTPFGVDAAEFGKPGVRKYELTGHDGWYDDAATSINAAMVSLAAGEHVLMLLQGNTAGIAAHTHAICAAGVLKTGYKRGFSVGDFTKANMELAVSGAKDEASLACPYAEYAGDGNTQATYVDLGAAGGGTTGGHVYMSCTALALTGSTNLILTLEDSANHIAWADNKAFTALVAVGAEMKEADATVDRYLSVKRVWTGLAGAPTATFVVAIKVHDPHA
ncbi:MAG TPA: hypothetical protein VFH61_08685 [Thermoleophilia bacterium]|nr:hypothetical protein [Thermoleophilia bacterium]